MAMRIDKFGRIVIPRQIRERMGLTPNTELEAVEQSGGVLLTIKAQQPSLISIDGWLVHQGVPDKGADWDVVAQVREERIRSNIGLDTY